MSQGDLRPSVTQAEEGSVPVFEHPPALVQFLDATEDAIRLRLARLRLFERVFLLERDWMTRITMLMIIAGILWGAIGGFDAFGYQTQVVAYATQSAVHLSNVEIYSSVTLHGIRELFGFAQQLEMAALGLLVINALGITPRHKWSLYSVVGLMNGAMLLLQGPVYLFPFNDNYFPAVGWYFLSPLGVRGQSAYVVSPLWFLGWLALCAAMFLWTGWVVVHLRDWYRAHRADAAGRRYPVFLWFVVGTLVLIPITYGPLVVSTVWDIGAAYAGWAISPLANQVIFWMFGHSLVYVLFLLPIVALYVLAPILARRPIYSYRFAVASAVMFVLLTPLLGLHHLYLAPVPAWSTWLTMALSFAIVLPSAITFFSVWMTFKGVPRSQWEWNAVALFTLLSFGGALFGGLSGPALATIPWDVDLHNSLFVLGHFHAMTILAIAAGGYALLYAVFPILTGRRWFSSALARAHFVFTAVGGSTIVLSMESLGSLGVLRRSYILPLVPEVTLYQIVLFGGIVVMLVGQLFFVANGALTVFRGELFSAAGLSFDEAVRQAAQSTAPPRARVPIADVPFARRVPRPRRERIEAAWVATVTVLLAAVLVAATPGALSVGNGITGASADPASEFVAMDGQQYYWTVHETGPVNGTFANAIVVYAGASVQVNLTATGATQSLLVPFRDQAVVDVQAVPGTPSYASFTAPTVPGVYGAPDGEYDGPWFGQDVTALIVLPDGADAGASLAAFEANGGGDIYNPPVQSAATADLVGNAEGLFNGSVPGPTLTATAPAGGGPVAFDWSVPLASIGLDNYLVNVTSTNPNEQQQYVIDHNYTLPYVVGVYRIVPATGLVPVNGTLAPIAIGRTVAERAPLVPGVYLYGLVGPVSYSYNPAGESGGSDGIQTGQVMGLWGVLWVASA